MRFPLECVKAIQDNTPEGFPVIVKFTPDQRVEGFRTLDEGPEIAKMFEAAGVTALHVDSGCYEEWFQAITTVYSKPKHKLDVQKAVKEVVSVPVLGDGKLIDPADACYAVEEGILDYVGLGHQMLADPYWPKKVKSGREDEIRPCIGCNECLRAGFSGKHYYCAVNPLCYAEKAFALPKPDGTKRSVLVIGGGPGGMQAAITARMRVFDAELWEATDRLGGTLWPAAGPEFKHDLVRLIDSMAAECERLGVDIKLNHPATEENLAGKSYDKVVLAAGSTPAVPPIPGIEGAVGVVDYLTHKAEVGKKVVVIGGGLAGTEAAIDIASAADEVTIVEMLPDILRAAADCHNNDQHLRKMVKEAGVKVQAGAKVINIAADGVTFEKDGETVAVPCDTVVNAAGFKAANQLEDYLLEHFDDVTVVGDCECPRKIMDAIHEGYHAIRTME